MLVTIFTPTYNRGYIISNLYESLIRQTKKKFEWIIIDDGSSDNTEGLINKYINDKLVNITYLKVTNGGKHRAINKGLDLAKGELFFIVDSDDYITDDAIEQLNKYWYKLNENNTISGMCFRRMDYNTAEMIGGKINIETGLYNSLELHFNLGVTGDKAEVFKTDILRSYKFPEIAGENFVPEAFIWNQIGAKYKLLFINKEIYMCDYLEDGLSANFGSNLKRNPRGFSLYYRDIIKYKQVTFLNKIKAVIRLIQCKYYATIKS